MEWINRIFFPASYYSKRLDALRKEFLDATEKDKLLASFAKFLLPLYRYFLENDVEDKWILVDKNQFNEVHKIGVRYYMGMKIKWF